MSEYCIKIRPDTKAVIERRSLEESIDVVSVSKRDGERERYELSKLIDRCACVYIPYQQKRKAFFTHRAREQHVRANTCIYARTVYAQKEGVYARVVA